MRTSFSLVSLALYFGFAAAIAIPATNELGTVEGLVGNAGGLALRGSATPVVARDPQGDDGLRNTFGNIIHDLHHGHKAARDLALGGSAPPVLARDQHGDNGMHNTMWHIIHDLHHDHKN